MAIVTALDPEFLDQITALEQTSQAADDATMLTNQRKWMYPPLQGWNGDPQDVLGMNNAFVRNHLNQTYKNVLKATPPEGTVGEAMVLKLQVDYIAALERAFRTRHCSSVRAKIHAAGRRRGQGATDGVFGGSVVLWLERLLFAAHDDPYALVLPGEKPND